MTPAEIKALVAPVGLVESLEADSERHGTLYVGQVRWTEAGRPVYRSVRADSVAMNDPRWRRVIVP